MYLTFREDRVVVVGTSRMDKRCVVQLRLSTCSLTLAEAGNLSMGASMSFRWGVHTKGIPITERQPEGKIQRDCAITKRNLRL